MYAGNTTSHARSRGCVSACLRPQRAVVLPSELNGCQRNGSQCPCRRFVERPGRRCRQGQKAWAPRSEGHGTQAESARGTAEFPGGRIAAFVCGRACCGPTVCLGLRRSPGGARVVASSRSHARARPSRRAPSAQLSAKSQVAACAAAKPLDPRRAAPKARGGHGARDQGWIARFGHAVVMCTHASASKQHRDLAGAEA